MYKCVENGEIGVLELFVESNLLIEIRIHRARFDDEFVDEASVLIVVRTRWHENVSNKLAKFKHILYEQKLINYIFFLKTNTN